MRSNCYITVTNPETGESKTFAPDEDLPDWAVEIIQDGNPDALLDSSEKDQDLIGTPVEEDPLMKRTHDDLVKGAEQWGAEGVSYNNKKADLAAAIRAAGYEGDGTDLLDGE